MPLDVSAAPPQTTPRETRLADYRPPSFLIDTVELSFDLDEAATRVHSRLALRRNPASDDRRAPLSLDGEDVTLVRVALDGAELGANRYRIEDGKLVIPDMPDAATLEIETRIAPKDNSELSGLYTSNGSFFTQCEAEGFRRITYFPDRPDVMARFTTTITADKARIPVMLSNGNPGAVEDAGAGRHRITWTDPHPKPCYLFALVAGDLVAVQDSFTTRSGRHVDLGIWVRRGDEDRCAHAMRSLKKAMQWDEEVFGLEYVLAKPETATDVDYQGIETVIAHEYFHNWTGNRVTCRDWFQLSLKEGLTVYRDQEFSADQGSRAVKRIGDVRALRAGQFREDSGPLAHPVQPDHYIAIDNFYTATVYNKGAEVIRMMAIIIGRENFRRGMDLYFARHDNQAVTIDDFAQAMQDASGTDLTRFRLWYHQAGTPEITVSDSYDATARRYTLSLAQHTPPTPPDHGPGQAGQPDKQPLVVPIAMGLLDADGHELTTRTLLLTQAEHRFMFEDVARPPTPSLLRGFSAPVKLLGVPLARLQFLAAHDTDPFVRWESGQQYATSVLLDMAAGWRRGEAPAVEPGLVDAMAATLRDADADHAFAAEALVLPGEAFLADQMAIADVDAIHAVRDIAMAATGQALRDELRTTHERLTDTGPYRIDGASMGRRALRNVCLGYLALASDDGAALAKAQFDAAQNMTDVLAALAVLSAIDCPERQAALDAFHARWREDDLALDKWFAIQALSPLPDTPNAVRRLSAHPDFDLKVPNRVRALVASFASGNQVRFHDATGSGYRFLADTITQLDPMNSQVAARLVAPLGQWRRVEPARQALMKQELQRILDVPGLSKGTYEMVSRSIA
jgi:aminopeptidase N